MFSITNAACKTTVKATAALIIASSTLFTTSASAQAMLEEVIVTAQKRAQSLQDVPISVSAMQGDKLESAGIGNMSALADHIPNLYISDAPVNTNIYMRGMGSGNNQAFEQSVGMYIDGVYKGRGRQYRSPFMDVERVEVLRGPQGTLFGKNTVAGAISVITRSPDLDEEMNGSLSLLAEENGGYSGEGYVSGALNENLAARLAVKYRQTDGYADNVFLGGEEPETEELVARLTLAWTAGDNLDFNLKYDHSNYERQGVASGITTYIGADERNANFPNRSAFANIAYLLTDLNYADLLTQAGDDLIVIKDNGFGPDGAGVNIGLSPESSDNDVDNAVLTTNYQMGEYTLTSVTGYSKYRYVDGCDCDWLPLQFISRDDDQRFNQFSQEIRIASPVGGFFEYVAGGYYERSDLEFDRVVAIDLNMDGLVQGALGLPSLFPLIVPGYTANSIGRSHYYKLDANSLAAFAQGTFNISDTFRITVGLRYTEEDKDVISTQFLSDDLLGIGIPNNNPVLAAIQAGSFDAYAYDYEASRKTDKWLPSLIFQWDVTDDSMLYLSLSQGFKSGGFTAADDGSPGEFQVSETAADCAARIGRPCSNTIPADDFEFQDEEVDAIEIGGKHTLLGGAMNLNWAAFYTQYENLQTSIFKGISFGVGNAAETTVQGLEIDTIWQASEGLQLGLNIAYLDAEYDSYPTAPCNALQLDADTLCGTDPTNPALSNNDLAGQRTTFAPEVSGSIFFDYELPMNSMDFFIGGEANYSDEFNTQGDADQIDVAKSFAKVNLRLGLRSDMGSPGGWEIMLFGRNITDEIVRSFSFDVPVLAGSHASMFDEGRVFGLRATAGF